MQHKNMKRLIIPMLLCVFVFGAAFNATAQRSKKVTLTWGDEHKKKKKQGVQSMHADGDGGLYMQRNKAILHILNAYTFPYMEHYNASMKRDAVRDIDLRYNKREHAVEGLVKIGAKTYLFTTLYNKETKNRDMFIQTLGGSKISSLESMKKIAEMPGDQPLVRGKFNIKASPDSSHLLLFSKLPRSLGDADNYAFRVFDNNMSLVWELNSELPYEADRFTIESHQIDNDGNVYVLGKYVDERSKGFLNLPTSYQFIILAYQANSKTPAMYALVNEDKFVTTLSFQVANDGDLICAGFYTVGAGIRGTFFAKVDPFDGRVYDQRYSEFDIDFITEGLSNWELRRAQKAEADATRPGAELNRYVVRKLIKDSNDGVTLIAEQHYIEDVGGGEARAILYYHNDIIITHIDAEGNTDWVARIPKLQETQNDAGRYSSFALGTQNDHLYFAYNDHIDNHQAGPKPNRRRTFKGRNSILVISEVSPDGTVKEYTLGEVSKGKGKYRMEPAKSVQTTDNSIAVYTSRKRRYKMGRLNLPK